MAEGSTKQDQDERRNVKEANPTCCTAPVVNCNCITMCQDNKTSMEPVIKELMDVLKRENKDEIEKYLKDLPNLDDLNEYAKRRFKGESLLHIALKFNNTNTFVKTVIKKNRSFLMEQRSECYMKKRVCQSLVGKLKRILFKEKERSPYEGQTPLHVAIAKGNYEAVKIILRETNEEETQKLFNTCAVGKEFKNTVLMGQLPLSVAALACKDDNFKKIIKCLLKRKAKIWNMNEKGDTVFHSLIKYADVYPDKIQNIKDTFEFLWENFLKCCERETKPTDIYFWKNNAGFTPLHLSAKLGVGELFNVLVDIKDVYSFKNIEDGLFDIREFDVTEFDRLIYYTEEKGNKWNLTILESLFDSKCTYNEAFQILNHELVEFILHRKWEAYKIILVIWMFAHFTFMVLFTYFTVEKSRLFFCNQSNEPKSLNNETISLASDAKSCDIGEEFYAAITMNVVVGISYFIFAFSCFLKLIGRCTPIRGNPCNFGLVPHNLDYIICLLVTSIGALMECFYIFLKTHSDIHLVLVLISGWYFMLYFSPFNKNLVSVTYMIKSGFLDDFVPFASVFIWLLVSFTAIMYMLFLGTDNVEEFDTFQNSLFTMFNLGVGLNNIDVLNQSRIPWLAYTIFVVFAILSFIHLFNALVAVMSTTFSSVHQERTSYLKYNKLRMIELFEDIVFVLAKQLPVPNHWDRTENVKPSDTCLKHINGHFNSYNLDHKRKVEENSGKRYFSVLHLLGDLSEYKDDIHEEKKKKEAKHFKTMSKYFCETFENYQKLSASSTRSNKIYPENEVTFVQIQQSK